MRGCLSILSVIVTLALPAWGTDEVNFTGRLAEGYRLEATITYRATQDGGFKCTQLRRKPGPFAYTSLWFLSTERVFKEETLVKKVTANRHGTYQLSIPVILEPAGDCGMKGDKIMLSVYDESAKSDRPWYLRARPVEWMLFEVTPDDLGRSIRLDFE